MSLADTFKVTTPTDTEIGFTRMFNAPRKLVWEAMSKPELLKKWLFGPPGWAMTLCEEDQRVGGKFRWEWKNDDGREMAMVGEYREIVAPERVVRTETFEFGCVPQSGEQLVTMTFTEIGKTTRMDMLVAYPTKEARDAMIASGMEHGMAADYDRLDDILSNLV